MAAKTKGLDKDPGGRMVTTKMLNAVVAHVLNAVATDVQRRSDEIKALEQRVAALERERSAAVAHGLSLPTTSLWRTIRGLVKR